MPTQSATEHHRGGRPVGKKSRSAETLMRESLEHALRHQKTLTERNIPGSTRAKKLCKHLRKEVGGFEGDGNTVLGQMCTDMIGKIEHTISGHAPTIDVDNLYRQLTGQDAPQ